MRDYIFFERYLNEIEMDIYEQPEDTGHTALAEEVINNWIPDLVFSNVIDMGCGTGFCSKFFNAHGISYTGLDKGVERSESPRIVNGDFSFTKLPDEVYDMVFSRHSLEHSPFPLLTLMEWHRIAIKYLLLVLPNPDYYTYLGRNHYSVMNTQQSRWILRRAGWKVMETDYSESTELRFLCEKQSRKGFEGYLEKLTSNAYEADRDGK